MGLKVLLLGWYIPAPLIERRIKPYVLAMAKKKPEGKIGMWQAVRDVLIASMSKGQFPLAIAALVIIVAILKMPQEDVSRLVFEVLNKLENGSLLGYLLAGATSIGWRIHVKWQRRVITSEMERISTERNSLQEAQLGAQVASSESPRTLKPAGRSKKT